MGRSHFFIKESHEILTSIPPALFFSMGRFALHNFKDYQSLSIDRIAYLICRRLY